MKLLEKVKYPKFILVLIIFILTYFLFKEGVILKFYGVFDSLGYFGIFLIGILFAFGFTAGPAMAMLIIASSDHSIFLAGIIAGCGALLSDLVIFKTIKITFSDEIEKLSKEKLWKHFKPKKSNHFTKYFTLLVASVIIASPLPNEIGVFLFALHRKISTKAFSIYCYVLNTLGICIILLLGKWIL
jgi:hypothetical protein